MNRGDLIHECDSLQAALCASKRTNFIANDFFERALIAHKKGKSDIVTAMLECGIEELAKDQLRA